MKTTNRARRNAGKSRTVPQSGNSPKNPSEETPKDCVYLTVIVGDGTMARELLIPKLLYQSLRPFITAGKSSTVQVAPGSVTLSPFTQAADDSMVAPLQIGSEVINRLVILSLDTKRSDLDIFRDAFLLGLRITEREREILNAVDEVNNIKEEMATLSELTLLCLASLNKEGELPRQKIERLEFGIFRWSQRLEHSLSASLDTIQQAVFPKPALA